MSTYIYIYTVYILYTYMYMVRHSTYCNWVCDQISGLWKWWHKTVDIIWLRGSRTTLRAKTFEVIPCQKHGKAISHRIPKKTGKKTKCVATIHPLKIQTMEIQLAGYRWRWWYSGYGGYGGYSWYNENILLHKVILCLERLWRKWAPLGRGRWLCQEAASHSRNAAEDRVRSQCSSTLSQSE